MSNQPKTLKIILIGNTGVGKTSLIYNYIGKRSTELKPTVNCDYEQKQIKIGSDEVNLQIWDTAGQEQFHSITHAYFRGASGAIVVFDITNEASFKSVDNWINDFKDVQGGNYNVILAGNKSDLESQRCVKNEQAGNYANSVNIKYFETSAKNGYNVDELFNTFLVDIYNLNNAVDTTSTDIASKKSSTEKKTCCNVF